VAIVVPIVLPVESDMAVIDIQKTVVGYGDTVSVASDVVEDVLRAGEWRLGIDDPFGLLQRFQIVDKFLRVPKGFQ
jgi:hypothetical protein